MDVTRIPRHGPAYGLIVDSYCLQGIVLDADREAVFGAVKARLDPHGYYLVSSAMYAAARHRNDQQVVDRLTGRVFDRYDEASLFDPDTDLYYQPYDGKEEVDGSIHLNGSWTTRSAATAARLGYAPKSSPTASRCSTRAASWARISSLFGVEAG